VEAAAIGGHTQHTGTECAPFCVKPERVLHRSDAVAEGEELEDVTA